VKRAIVVALASLGGVLLFLIVFLLGLSWALFSPTPLPDRMVLEVDLNQGLVETVPDDPIFLALERRRLRTREVVEALERAREDDRVVAVLFRGGGGLPGWGTAEEFREAVEAFRESEKPAWFFAETFGEFMPGHASYYLATAFDRIYLQPSGEVGLTGLSVEAPFLREALEKLDVEPRFDQRREYKSAAEMFTETGFTGPARDALRSMLESMEEVLVAGIVRGRDRDEATVRHLLTRGPFPSLEAVEAGLVDELLYLDQVRDRLEDETGVEAEGVGASNYLSRSGRGWDRGTRVALVYGVGPVLRGSGGYDPLTGGTTFGADRVAAAIREATDDDRVRAILFRVNSPGGSWVASDQVRRALERAREQGKPVVVSMGDVAASGGYLVAVDADRILAHPSTLTGSIGVIAGRFVTRDFWDRFGVTWDRVEGPTGADYYTAVDDFSPEAWERFQLFLDRIYDDFKDRVAQGRDLGPDRVEELARGRVWTGTQALERGLVDELGGYLRALDAVRELAELEPGAPLQVVIYPAEKTLFQLLMEEGRGVSLGEGLGAARALFRSLGVGAGGAAGPVRMPSLEVLGR
jgi:protease IV